VGTDLINIDIVVGRVSFLREETSGLRSACEVAAEPGFEPGPKDPKSSVLPLHHSAPVPKAGFEPARELPPNSF
jgi:hypothetical protein